MTRTEFGKMLQQARIDRDMSYRDLGKLVGLSAAYLHTVEHGRASMPTVQRVIDLAVTLGHDPDMWCLHAGHYPPRLLAALMQRPGRVGDVIRFAERL